MSFTDFRQNGTATSSAVCCAPLNVAGWLELFQGTRN
uniref:Uncharacterized protein n=1 Tax=Moniliophthora roreri TaxID=221103 RepID=A0A0W0GDM9_MONRR